MKNFKQLIIWRKGLEIATQFFRLTETFPKEKKYGLSSQITRAAVSIPSNIAEGSSRTSEKDYNRFLQHSLGSLVELENQLLIAEAIKYGKASLRQQMLQNVTEEQKMIVSFMKKLDK